MLSTPMSATVTYVLGNGRLTSTVSNLSMTGSIAFAIFSSESTEPSLRPCPLMSFKTSSGAELVDLGAESFRLGAWVGARAFRALDLGHGEGGGALLRTTARASFTAAMLDDNTALA